MKNITLIALTAILAAAGPAQAGPLDFLFKLRPGQQEDRRDDRHDDRRDDRNEDRNEDRQDWGRGNDRDGNRAWERDNDNRRPMSVEARAQLRLRELGYYRGAIDGSFGRGSKAALARFQRDNGIRPTGWLDERTRRALRI